MTSIGDLLADILATLGMTFVFDYRKYVCWLDVELSPSDDATSKETFKQRFFQLINNSEVRTDSTIVQNIHL